jgi:1,4-dihydroxy-6-naphthoate synthase
LLNAGSALGFGVGPLLISKKGYSKDEVKELRIAIPGKYTTANFLFSLAFPSAKNKSEMIFSEIENAVLDNKVDAGVIIHENRFTYAQKGLKKIIDLGEWWEKETGSAIPLGGIVIQRALPDHIKQKVDRTILRSVEYAFADPGSSRDFVRANAQEMDEAVMQKHIDLYVNKYSVDLGNEGRKAVRALFSRAKETGFIKEIREDIFMD